MTKKIFLIIIIFLAIVTAISAGFSFKSKFEYDNLKKEVEYLKSQPGNELPIILKDLEKIMALPKDEIPTLATIKDVEKLRASQPFYNNAKNGDKLILYAKAQKAILYDPKNKKIIDIAPFNVPTPTPVVVIGNTTTLTPEPTSPQITGKITGTKTTPAVKTANTPTINPPQEITITPLPTNDSKTIVP